MFSSKAPRGVPGASSGSVGLRNHGSAAPVAIT